MLNLGGGIQRDETTAGMDSNKRMNWTRLRDGDLSVKKFKKMKEVSKLRFLFKKNPFFMLAHLSPHPCSLASLAAHRETPRCGEKRTQQFTPRPNKSSLLFGSTAAI